MSVAAPITASAGVASDASEKIVIVPGTGIADPTKPTVAELTGAGVVDTCPVLAEFGVGADQEKGSITRVCLKTPIQVLGRTTWTLDNMVYAWDPQGALATENPDLNKLGDLLVNGFKGYVVYRPGMDASEPFAAGQVVWIFRVTFGSQVPQKPEANSESRAFNAVTVEQTFEKVALVA